MRDDTERREDEEPRVTVRDHRRVTLEGELRELEPALDEAKLDELFWQSVQVCRDAGEASPSRLQKTFGINYLRAERIIDQMHALGIVGPPRGRQPRKILPGGPTGPTEPRP